MRLALALSFICACALACGDSGAGSVDAGPVVGPLPTDVDGYALKRFSPVVGAPSSWVLVFDPRTGNAGPGIEVLPTTNFAASPDGRSFAFMTGTAAAPSIGVYEVAVRAGAPLLEEKILVPVPPGSSDVRFGPRGRWIFTDFIAIHIESGEQVECEMPRNARVLPDGEHVLIDCQLVSDPITALYKGGERVWWAGRFGAPSEVSLDGQWVYFGRGSQDVRALHIPSRTLLAHTAIQAFEPASESYRIDGSDPVGRHAYLPWGEVGRQCDATIKPPAEEGFRFDPEATAVSGTRGAGRQDVPFGGEGPLLETMAMVDERQVVEGVSIVPAGFDPLGENVFYQATGYWVQYALGGGCSHIDIAYRLRRTPMDGSGAQDFLGFPGPCIVPSHEVHPLATKQGESPGVLGGPGGTLICSIFESGYNPGMVVMAGDDVAFLEHGGTVLSPGRRYGMRIVNGNHCLQKVVDGAIGCALDTTGGEDPKVWGGWSLPTARGAFDEAAVYRVSHLAAYGQSEVEVFGRGFGTSGTLQLGDHEIPTSQIDQWDNTRIVFRMPEDAPTELSKVSVDAGLGILDVAPRLIRRTELWAPPGSIQSSLEVIRGTTVTIPTANIAVDTALVKLGTNVQFNLDGTMLNATSADVVAGGFQIDIPADMTTNSIMLFVQDGTTIYSTRLDLVDP